MRSLLLACLAESKRPWQGLNGRRAPGKCGHENLHGLIVRPGTAFVESGEYHGRYQEAAPSDHRATWMCDGLATLILAWLVKPVSETHDS